MVKYFTVFRIFPVIHSKVSGTAGLPNIFQGGFVFFVCPLHDSFPPKVIVHKIFFYFKIFFFACLTGNENAIILYSLLLHLLVFPPSLHCQGQKLNKTLQEIYFCRKCFVLLWNLFPKELFCPSWTGQKVRSKVYKYAFFLLPISIEQFFCVIIYHLNQDYLTRWFLIFRCLKILLTFVCLHLDDHNG